MELLTTSTITGTLLIAARVVAMMLVAPILGHRAVPMMAKLGIGIVLSLAAAPLILSQSTIGAIEQPQTLADLATAMFSQALIGLMIGLGAMIIFSAAIMIGSAIGQISGLQIDSIAGGDSGFGSLPTSKLIGMTAATAFVLIGGPEITIGFTLDSFQSLPIGDEVGGEQALSLIVALLNQSFQLVVRAIAPAVATLLAATMLVGFLSRTMPQLNLIQLGLSSNVALMLVAVGLTLGGSVFLVLDQWEPSLQMIVDRTAMEPDGGLSP